MAGFVAFCALFDSPGEYTPYSEVVPGKLYISACENWYPGRLRIHNIERVISVGEPLRGCNPQELLAYYDIVDNDGEDITRVFKTVIEFARDNRGATMVNCRAGVSRSASVVLVLLMALYGHDLESAARTLLAVRPCVKPNSGFLWQVYQHAAVLGKLTIRLRLPADATTIARYIVLRRFDRCRIQQNEGPLIIHWEHKHKDDVAAIELKRAFPHIQISIDPEEVSTDCFIDIC